MSHENVPTSNDISQVQTKKKRKHKLTSNEKEPNETSLNHGRHENDGSTNSCIPLATITNSTITSRPTKRKRQI